MKRTWWDIEMIAIVGPNFLSQSGVRLLSEDIFLDALCFVFDKIVIVVFQP